MRRPLLSVTATVALVLLIASATYGLTHPTDQFGKPPKHPHPTKTTTAPTTAPTIAATSDTTTAPPTDPATDPATTPTDTAPTSTAPTSTAPTSVTPTPTPTSTSTSSTCAVTTQNVPDGPDGAGGCFPGPSNTGPDAPASAMPTYAGSCTISVADTTIDSSVVNCRELVVAASGFTLSNSYLYGGIVQPDGNPASFTVKDSLVDSGVQYPACSDGSCPAGTYACGDTNNQTTDCGVTGANFTILRTEITNSNRAAYCESNCLVQDSYFHGTNLWPDRSNLAHASSMREEQGGTIRHNTLWCSYEGPFPNNEIGCSADLTGYADFAPINHNTVDRNLFAVSPGSGFCAYGGGTSGKPYSGSPNNATYQVFTNNVFQLGSNGLCAAYGPVTDFIAGRPGNVWSGNVYDDGSPVPAA
jgi:hypothetical protein